MNGDTFGALFVSLMPQLRSLVRVPQDTPAEDVLHEALMNLLEVAESIPDDPQEATVVIQEAVVRASKRALKRRNRERERFPPATHWRIGGKYLGPLYEESMEEQTDPVDRIPDTRESPEGAIEASLETVQLARVTQDLQNDPRHGPVFRLLFKEGVTDRKEIAQRLGISYSAARKRVRTVLEELKRLGGLNTQ